MYLTKHFLLGHNKMILCLANIAKIVMHDAFYLL